MSGRIKVGQLRDIQKEIDDFKVVEFKELKIEVKQYLSTQEKRTIAETIVHASFVDDKETGLIRFDRGLADATWGYLLIRNYTNINNMKDPLEMYDTIKSIGLLDFVEESIPEDEINSLTIIIRNRINEVYRVSEASMGVGFKLEGLIDIIVEKIDNSLEMLKNFDTKDLETISNIIKIEDVKEE